MNDLNAKGETVIESKKEQACLKIPINILLIGKKNYKFINVKTSFSKPLVFPLY